MIVYISDICTRFSEFKWIMSVFGKTYVRNLAKNKSKWSNFTKNVLKIQKVWKIEKI